jgi:2-polyprenyl-3-methyl-5-hydroxy-6-metoxy-1,4-benzoquinol methylase
MDVSVYESQCKGRWRTAAKHFEILSYYRSKGTLLDVGCASGMFLELAAKAGWRIAGVEPSVRLFEIAQKRLGGKGQILHTTLQKADFQTPSFDAVTLWDVLSWNQWHFSSTAAPY